MGQGVERVNDQREEHGRDGVALPETFLVTDGGARVAIDEHTCFRHGEQDGDPLAPPWAKAKVPKKL